MGTVQPPSTGGDVPPYREAIQRLPQAAILKESDIDRYLAWLESLDPAEAAFQVRRLSGWGGSEIGVLVAESRGERAPFSCARHLAMGKLLMRTSDDASIHIDRGHAFEPVARAMLRGRGLREDTDGLARFRAFSASRDADRAFRWAGGSPDDLLLAKGGRRLLPDYKIPAEPPERDDPVMFEYVAQLHQYAMLARAAGIEADRLAIVNLSFPQATLLTPLMENPLIAEAITRHVVATMGTDRAVADLVIQPVGFSQDFAKEIEDVGAATWADVLRGKLPPWPRRTETHGLGESDVQQLRKLERIVAYCSKVGEAIAEREVAAREHIAALAAAKLQQNDSLPLELTSHQRRRVTDWKAVAKELESQGVAPSQFRQTTYDTKAMAKALQDAGIDPEQFARHGELDKVLAEKAIGEDQLLLFRREHHVVVVSSRSASKAAALNDICEVAREAATELVTMAVESAQTAGADSATQESGNRASPKVG